LIADAWRAGGTTSDAVARLRSDFGLELPRSAEVSRELTALQRLGIAALGLQDPNYPPLLAATPDPPVALFVQGNDAVLQGPLSIAIVGSRRASAPGRAFARALAGDLGRAGFVIVSGLAAGIDGSAHRGALDANAITVAVMGGGHAKVYPASHLGLAREVVASGALIAEYPPSSAPMKGNFPERNRIISGLAAGVVVIEATVRSGSLITARMALEQGREVLAVPGPVLDGNHGGCHRLLKQGAALVEDALDVLEAFGVEPTVLAQAQLPSDPILAGVLNAVTYSVALLQDIVESLAMPVDQVLSALVELEIEGFVETYRGGYIRRPRTVRDR
jgi:DNA processing protein